MRGFSNRKPDNWLRIKEVKEIDERLYDITLLNNCGTMCEANNNFSFKDDQDKAVSIYQIDKALNYA